MKALILIITFFIQDKPLTKEMYVNAIVSNEEVCTKTNVYLNVTDKIVEIRFLRQVHKYDITSTQADGTLILKDSEGTYYNFSGTEKQFGFLLELEGTPVLMLATYNMCE